MHERVLEALMERGPVLPLRFGTRVATERELEATLRERRNEFLRALERVRGRVEIGVRVLGEREERPRRRARTGREYLRGKLAKHRRAEHAAREVHVPLAELAVEGRVAEHMSPPTILIGSYLVDTEDVAGFRARAEELAAREPRAHVVVTGPWPPYSFVSEPLGDEPRRSSGEESA